MAEVKILMFKFVRDRNDEMYLNKTEYIDDMRSKN